MNSSAIKFFLFVVLSIVLTACGGSEPVFKGDATDQESGSEVTDDLGSELTTVVKSLPEGTTTLPYSSMTLDVLSDAPFTFRAEGLPAWASINTVTGKIEGTPNKADAGITDFKVVLTAGDQIVEKDMSIVVRHGASYLTSDAIDFYDQTFAGAKRVLRNDLSGALEGEVQFMQTHNIRPNKNYQPDTGDETRSVYRPNLVAQREALLLFIPTNVANIASVHAEISINGEVQQVIAMAHPNDLYTPDYNGPSKVVFSQKSWNTRLPWQVVKNGLSIRFIVNKQSQTEQIGSLVAADIDIGEASQLVFQSIRLGMLTYFITENAQLTLNDPITAASDYFQTIPVSRLVMGSYADMRLNKVMVRSGVIYDNVSATDGGVYNGDMRSDVAKAQVSTGINQANYGITSNDMNQRYPHVFKQITNHHASGLYQNGHQQHGLSGGNGIGTLMASRGNEASHEWGHAYGMGHYPGAGLTDDERFAYHHADSGWGYIAYRKRLRHNLNQNSESDEVQSQEFRLIGKIPYNRDAMSGGSPNSKFSQYTHYTAYTARFIQNDLAKFPLPDASFASGYKKWDTQLGEYKDYRPATDTTSLAPKEVGVAVATLLGGYVAEENKAVIYPVFHGNYGNVFDLPEADLLSTDNQCWISVSNAQGEEKHILVASQRHSANSANQISINLKAEFRPTLAALMCRREGTITELTRTVFDGQIPDLPPVAIVGQDAGINQLKEVEIAALSAALESQAGADIIKLTTQQKEILNGYSTEDLTRLLSAQAQPVYQKYAEMHASISKIQVLIAKLKKEAADDSEQASIIETFLKSQPSFATSTELTTNSGFLSGPTNFGAIDETNNYISATSEESLASQWMISSQGRIHLANKPWLCLTPVSGRLMANECSTQQPTQYWSHEINGTIKNQSSNQCIDFAFNNSTIVMYGCHTNFNQRWNEITPTDNKLLALLDSDSIKRLYELLKK